jgi:hypothetical protein
MACDLFSIPAMSAECERVFSHAKHLITDERHSLGDDTIEAHECQGNWIRNAILTENELHKTSYVVNDAEKDTTTLRGSQTPITSFASTPFSTPDTRSTD